MRKADRDIIEILQKLGLRFKFFVGQEVIRISTQELGTVKWVSNPRGWWIAFRREGTKFVTYLECDFVRPRYLKDVEVR